MATDQAIDRLTRAATAARADIPARPLDWNRRFLPRYFTDPPATPHRWLDGYLHDLHRRRGSRAAVVAPREAAKSTWVTLAYALRAAVEGWEPYTLILGDTADQAAKHLADLRAEVEGSPALAAAYPGACGPGGVWRAGAVRLRNGALVEALGRGARVRGRRNRSARPSLVILDDVQGNRDIISPTERRRAWDWFAREVLPAGTDTTNVISVGTALHREAVAVRAGTLPGWLSATFPAVISWPARADLWADWERRATNLADPGRNSTAAAFYEQHRAEMDRGAETFWPARKPIAALMAKRAEVGPSAFDTEYQGNPAAPDGAEWPAAYFDRPGLWFTAWPDDLVLQVQSLDPSKGSADRPGDWQAHVLLGLSRNGDLWAEAVLAREPVPDMVGRALDLPALSGFGRPDELAVEDNDGLGLLADAFRDECRRRGRAVPLVGVRNTANKVARVRRLGTYFGRGQVRFRDAPGTRMLVDQLREFPLSQWDDGPDALELAARRLEHLARPV